MDETANCIICKKSLNGEGDVVTLKEKGSEGINRASAERVDNITTVPGQQVHQNCRREYCRPSSINRAKKSVSDETTSSRRSLTRKGEQCFSFKTDCFFCGTKVELGLNSKRKRLGEAFRVTTVETKDTILKICSERNDDWSETIRARLMNVHDLPAADAIYHQTCNVNFRTNRQLPQVYEADELPVMKKRKIGRPQNEEKNQAFVKVTKFLEENDDEQITVGDLVEKMKEYLNDTESEAYGRSHMKTKLLEYFGDKIIITDINGKPNVVTFKTTATAILQEFHAHEDVLDIKEEQENIIKTAAKLIKNDLKSIPTSSDSYPTITTDAESHARYLPASLSTFLSVLNSEKNNTLKVASIGQAIVQAARPRVVIAPLQIGLAVQLHHNFASRFLIDTLHQHGFCSSYQEVQMFNKNAALSQGTDIPSFNGEFVQYAADNVDHNTRTLDGHNTFHGMGMIAVVTPGTKHSRNVARRKVTPEEISATGRVEIHPCGPRQVNVEIKYKDLVLVRAEDPTASLDILWKTSLLFGNPRPSWSGMMQLVHQGRHQGKSSVMFLPMIDMNPSDVTCVSSTLHFVSEHAKQHSIANPIVTFDQPLWLKAFNIIQTEPANSDLRKVIVRLGAFHAEMSFLGSIGHLMAGSGLREVLELIYASNAVDHIMTGKAISRAVRADLIVDAALNALLYSEALEVPVPHLHHTGMKFLCSCNHLLLSIKYVLSFLMFEYFITFGS